ncbi:MotA/TolQ/ExbB proton channel family protein [Myxacorys almedinensis]|uniref:MotA/TolQ/ExbB proton channel family protein n=1 Tax=Myxacorys almedinensis A TaxID=2690445 RepID=A0A8J7Z038_9CYAN|nr:MotA/TolQ/ExbB proton channel family protein [Myxacorys almedinensis]NDJ17714.1 MotA/TolQ/ExbB proton channel family protein [Myxacorys almedinensis A]
MSTLFELLAKGGPVMVPVAGLSILTIACALERSWFWWHVLSGESRIARQVLETAKHDLQQARSLAESASDLPIARFLLAPLTLKQPNPETFRLAMEAAGDREFAQMRKGDKLLETVIAMAPLLGLLGTVSGLIVTFFNLRIGGGGSAVDTSRAVLGIAEALITTASGMVVAIVALAAFRVCVALQSRQIDYFSDIGSELELIYRQFWGERDEI